MIEIDELEQEKLIYSIIHKNFPDYPYKDDLFQEGYTGYMDAVKRYDPSYDAKLSTYAYPYIYWAMKKYLRKDKSIKVSREIQLLALKLEKVSALLSQSLYREPTIEELSQYLQIPEEKIIEAKLSMQTVQSIDEPINCDGKEMTLHDTIAEDRNPDIDRLLMLRSEMSKLSQKDQALLKYRYMEDMTQSEVAARLDTTQVQVSRRTSKLLSKLRNNLN